MVGQGKESGVTEMTGSDIFLNKTPKLRRFLIIESGLTKNEDLIKDP
jgi:hypothetical protein